LQVENDPGFLQWVIGGIVSAITGIATGVWVGRGVLEALRQKDAIHDLRIQRLEECMSAQERLSVRLGNNVSRLGALASEAKGDINEIFERINERKKTN